jgi:hypothetical protein
MKHGLSAKSFVKYDERKPGFGRPSPAIGTILRLFARGGVRRAKDGNCVFIGAAGSPYLRTFPAVTPFASSHRTRCVWAADEGILVAEKKAQALVQESDANRLGFHKCFFNIDHDDPSTTTSC